MPESSEWQSWRLAGELLGRVRKGLGFGELTLLDNRPTSAFVLYWRFGNKEGQWQSFAFDSQSLLYGDSIERYAEQIVNSMKRKTKGNRYLCERCGGSGRQEAGCWSGTAYDSTAGVCQTCDGEGYLGLIL